MRRLAIAGTLALAGVAGVAAFAPRGEAEPPFEPATGPITDLDWDMLVPAGDAGVQTAGIVEHEQTAEDGPWQSMTDTDAVRADLDGRRVRLPGYMTPLSFEDTEVSEFLLVPYVGACVHVPPPPANQIVYVEVAGGRTVPVLEMWDPFLAVGTLRTQAQTTELAEIGYTMTLDHLEIYEEPEIEVFDDTDGDEPPAQPPTMDEVTGGAGEAGAGASELGRVFDDAFGTPGSVLGE